MCSMTSLTPDVLNFWFGEGTERGKRHKRWFEKNPAFDAEVAERFRGLYDQLSTNRDWLDPAPQCLARILVLHPSPPPLFPGPPPPFPPSPPPLPTPTPP